MKARIFLSIAAVGLMLLLATEPAWAQRGGRGGGGGGGMRGGGGAARGFSGGGARGFSGGRSFTAGRSFAPAQVGVARPAAGRVAVVGPNNRVAVNRFPNNRVAVNRFPNNRFVANRFPNNRFFASRPFFGFGVGLGLGYALGYGWGGYDYPYLGYDSGYGYPYYDTSTPYYDYSYPSTGSYNTAPYTDTYPQDFAAPPMQPAPTATTATIEVIVPADAQVAFDGAPTRQKGTDRIFVTPSLPAGQSHYTVTATWTDNGQPVTREMHIRVAPGSRVLVNFQALR
jgi:uncharacterized protein (TIGR03000 family)